MEPKTITKQMIDFNKTAFDNTFDTITIFLYYSEKAVKYFWEKAHYFSPEGEKIITEWMEISKNSRKDFKESVDHSFDEFEQFILNLTNATGFFVETLVENTDQPATEKADNSIQTEAIIKDETQKQDKTEKEMTVEGDSGAKTVRKSVKQLKKIKNKNQEEENGTQANRKTDD